MTINNLIIYVLLLLILFCCFSYAQDIPLAAIQKYKQEMQTPEQKVLQQFSSGSAKGQINWEDGYIIVCAFGAADQTLVQSVADEKVQAENAAYYNAIEQLAEIVLGIHVTANITIRNMTHQDGTIRQRIKGYLTGVDHLEESTTFDKMADGSLLAKTCVGYSLYGPGKLVPKLNNDPAILASLTNANIKDYTPDKSKPTPQYNETFTGLVLDCRNLTPSPTTALIQRIATPDGKMVYSERNVSRTVFSNGEMMVYRTAMDKTQDVVGKNPLIIMPQGTNSENGQIVISQADANKIIFADNKASFLSQARVALVY